MSEIVEALQDRILREGPITFYEFMDAVLYGTGGYYARSELRIGPEGDFVTGSSLSPLFGRTTARVLRNLDHALGRRADYLEAGYGGAVHLEALSDALGTESERRLFAWDRVRRPVPANVRVLRSLEDLSRGQLEGLIFSYELFDALPVHRLLGRDGARPGELWVSLSAEGDFCWWEGELSRPGLLDLLRGFELAPGQIADLAPDSADLYRHLLKLLGRGVVVTCDYGFETGQLLDPRIRRSGTLACYSRQRAHRNPFVKVGEQDLSAHVDFSRLVEAGESLGFKTLGLSRQARWLTSAGLFEELQGAGLEARHQAIQILDGEGMGEEIRVLVQAKGVAAEEVMDVEIFGGPSPASERSFPRF